MTTVIMFLLVLTVVLAVLSLHLYGIYNSFKAGLAWGIVSIFVAPLAFAVGAIKLITKKNVLIVSKK